MGSIAKFAAATARRVAIQAMLDAGEVVEAHATAEKLGCTPAQVYRALYTIKRKQWDDWAAVAPPADPFPLAACYAYPPAVLAVLSFGEERKAKVKALKDRERKAKERATAEEVAA
jgi:hypothetical protein